MSQNYSFSLFKKAIQFSLFALVILGATFFLAGNLSAQSWGNVWSGSESTTLDSSQNWNLNSFNGSNTIEGTQHFDPNSYFITQPTNTILCSPDLGVKPLDKSSLVLPDATISGGSLSSVGTGNPGELIGPNFTGSNPFLTGSNSYNLQGINISSGTVVDFAGGTIKIAEIDLADGSKIINGIIALDKSVYPNPFFSEDVEAALNEMSISQDENQVYDLHGVMLILPGLNFKNGGKIVDATINITSDHPDYTAIHEILVDDSKMIVNNPINLPALSPTTEAKPPVLSGEIPAGTVIDIPAKDLNGTAVSSDKLIINRLE